MIAKQKTAKSGVTLGLSYSPDDPDYLQVIDMAVEWDQSNSNVGKLLVGQRLRLLNKGWRLFDKKTLATLERIVAEPTVFEICQTIAHLEEKEFKRVVALLAKATGS